MSKGEIYSSKNGFIVYKPVGDYDRDLVINDGEIKNYNHQAYSIKQLRREYKKYGE